MQLTKTEIAERYFTAIYNAPDAASAIAISEEQFSPHFIDHAPVFGSSPDKQGFQRSLGIIQTAFTQKYQITSLIREDPFFVGIWSAEILHDGNFLGFLPATGNRFTITGITVYEIINGLITRHWEHFDQIGLQQQLGLLPKTGQ